MLRSSLCPHPWTATSSSEAYQKPDWRQDEHNRREKFEADGQHILELELDDAYRLLRGEGGQFDCRS